MNDRPGRPSRAPLLYLVTDRRRTRGRPLAEVVEQALAGGVDAVQLREKDLPGLELAQLARTLLPICRRHRAPLLINDRIDVALAVGADGVHLPSDSFTAQDARVLLGPTAWIGASTHSAEQARGAAGADFLVFGPIYDTPSKRAYGAPQGPAVLTEVVRSVDVPVLAIGGITTANIREVRTAGACGVAVIGAILQADDPRAAAGRLLGQ